MEIEVSRWPTVHAALALARQAKDGAVAHPLWNLHVEAPTAVQRDPAAAAVESVLQRHRKLHLDIASRHRDPDAAAPAASRRLLEERGEEVAERLEPSPLLRAALGSAPPRARGWREVHPALPVAAEGVVLGALLGIAQHLVGFVDLLEPFAGLGPLRGGLKVRMVLPGQLAVGALDLLCRRLARHAEHLVVVTIFHRHDSPSSRLAGFVTTTCARRERCYHLLRGRAPRGSRNSTSCRSARVTSTPARTPAAPPPARSRPRAAA